MRYLSLCVISMACVLGLAAPLAASEPAFVLDVWPGKAPGEDGSIGTEKFQDQKAGEKPVKLLTNVTIPRSACSGRPETETPARRL